MTNIQSLRTPYDRFRNLPDYPFAPVYIDTLCGYEGLRVHYLDEGPKDAKHTFLCLHGQPAWSYLYRKMIPVFTAAGHRVIAPDLIGFGRSDKPIDEHVYTFSFHRNMLISLISALNLNNLTLVCQDWGGILGLTIPPDMPDRFGRLLLMNTAIPTGEPQGEGFEQWRAYNRSRKDLDIAALLKRGCPQMTDAEAAAYNAPYPDATYKAGVRRFPELVMTSPEMDGVEEAQHAKRWWQRDWTGKTFMAVGMRDPVLGPSVMSDLQTIIRNCPSPLEVHEAGHFVQEWGEQVAHAALTAFDAQCN